MADLTEGSTISLADDILLPTLARFKANHPDKGILKLLAQLKLEHSGWAISEKWFENPSPDTITAVQLRYQQCRETKRFSG
ncbi:hypothetical protein L204_101618 [Cryptococcus depauperatus]